MEKSGVVAMRLFANWEMDRTSSSTVQRVFTLSINRLIFNSMPTGSPPLVITAKLQGHKRNLRTNELPIVVSHGKVDMDLDVSFNIQYPHFLKMKENILQIMIQRKRKYKNRPIPGGFKTLAIGMVNLSHLLQQGGLREIVLWNADENQKDTNTTVHSVGRLCLTSCQTVALDIDWDRSHKKISEGAEISEDDSDSEYDDMPMDSDVNEQPGTGRSQNRRSLDMKSKLVRRKNLKQKFVNLLRKFKVPEDEVLASSARASVAGAPTAKELEDLFEELEEMSDSGPEMAGDNVSIGSNPRPALRPFFTRSREVLPAIYDRDALSDSEPEDIEWSSEEKDGRLAAGVTKLVPPTEQTANMIQTTPSRNQQQRISLTSSVPLAGGTGPAPLATQLPHSSTTGSISKREGGAGSARYSSVSEQLTSILASESFGPGLAHSAPVSIWLCSQEAAQLTSLSVQTINCTNVVEVKQAIGQIVAKIHNFCNSNSTDPPVTIVGVIGGDRLIGHVLRAYVDCLHHKSSSNWLPYLRFAIIPPPHSLIGRLICGVEPVLDQLSRDIWEHWAELSLADITQINERLEKWGTSPRSETAVHLPIGEALLQLSETQESESGSVFVPFLAEVRVGQQEDENSDGASPRLLQEDLPERPPTKEMMTSQQGPLSISVSSNAAAGGSSPPCSPYNRSAGDAREMNVEYWVAKEGENVMAATISSTSTTPNAKKDAGKGSMKTAFRSLMITRAFHQSLLSLSFVKEKRKDKMLQKLGMKKGQKSDVDFSPVQITRVTRLLCSGTGKHSELNVCVDGSSFHGVRYFQTSAQWQTHIKSFPVSMPAPGNMQA